MGNATATRYGVEFTPELVARAREEGIVVTESVGTPLASALFESPCTDQACGLPRLKNVVGGTLFNCNNCPRQR